MRKLICALLLMLIISVALYAGSAHVSTSQGELAPTSSPTPSPTPTPSPPPSPSPTAKIVPGSPLSLGGSAFAEFLAQFDLMGIAKLVLVALGVIWLIVILFYVDREFGKKESKKSQD